MMHVAMSESESQNIGNNASKWDDNWDKRQFYTIKDGEKDKETTAKRHIILIRHGQYHTSGKTDEERSLTELGKKQAKETGKRLQYLLSQETKREMGDIYESTMTRAKETSAIIQNYFPTTKVHKDDLLREGPPIPPVPPHPTWKPLDHQFYADGHRIEAAFRTHMHRASPKEKKNNIDIYVCHGNVIRYFVCRALQFPPDGWLRMNVAHCSITILTIHSNGHVSLEIFGGSGHMPRDMITF